ncbi:D-ribose pyranase [Deinococcus proteolyticus MRP]|uniref:D-ribose pyranase n=1 Tax=Deinococcus proteolyticus (strain ATCC 35074 / DSM 20540 / JCM 6276 / NBRC 101906 / NCIMB 13154 / VKM Ac-1939 / CCM 2703 / MRP) TaxID=693977 RepID=F0RJP3_DEIPM|nr:D-ribose pyranase [Deinococcus proteolyticus]ADY26613.1 D-ribose pyranase [Deinococcus proteolyticus MRP]
MKKSGLLNPELSALVAQAGHTQRIVLADAGLPIPPQVRCIDVSVSAGLPQLLPVLQAILGELVVETVSLAQETRDHSPGWYSELRGVLPDVPVHEISHEALKEELPQALAVIRTGETTPYANIILHCGVNF